MEQGLEDFIDRIAVASSDDEIGAVLRTALAREGYENLVFVETRDGALTDIVWAELPDGYVSAYVAEGWQGVDPVLRHAMATTRAFLWDSLANGAPLARPQRAFMADCAALGLRAGVTIPLHGPSGQVDLLSVSMRERDPPPPDRLRHIHALCLQAWLRRADLKPTRPQATPLLSRREFECLKWLKEGKSNWEISQILSISEKTVEFHVGNVMRKLNAENRLLAVVLALRAGLLTL